MSCASLVDQLPQRHQVYDGALDLMQELRYQMQLELFPD
jgi:hypothetical protein